MPPSSFGSKNEIFRRHKRDELHVFSGIGKSTRVRFDLDVTEKDKTKFRRAEKQQKTKISEKTPIAKNLNFLFSFLFYLLKPSTSVQIQMLVMRLA